MLTTSRKAVLLERLASDGQLQVGPLAREFDVSEDTMRRDLRELAAEGKLIRVHGGAIPASPTHVPLTERHGKHESEKARLGKSMAELIETGMVVIIDGGTTHLHIAPALPTQTRCTIVTHSPGIAMSFEHHPNIEVVLIGGRIFRHSMVALGAETTQAFGRIRADLCLLGVTGVHPDPGLTTGDSEEALIKRVMMGAAAETAVAVTPDKIGRASAWQIAPLDQLSTLIQIGERPGWLPGTVAHIAG